MCAGEGCIVEGGGWRVCAGEGRVGSMRHIVQVCMYVLCMCMMGSHSVNRSW